MILGPQHKQYNSSKSGRQVSRVIKSLLAKRHLLGTSISKIDIMISILLLLFGAKIVRTPLT